MASLQELTERVKSGVGDDSGLGKSVKFDLKAMGKRELNPMTAVMKGRMRLSDMGLAMALQPQVQALFSRMVAEHG